MGEEREIKETAAVYDAMIGEDGSLGGAAAPEPLSSVPRQLQPYAFRPGTTVQPTPAQRAEGKAASYRAAIVNNVPPERIVGWLNKAAELAASNRSWRGMLEVADIALRYGIGKPRAMADDAGAVDLTALLQTIAGLAEREGMRGEGERGAEMREGENNLTDNPTQPDTRA